MKEAYIITREKDGVIEKSCDEQFGGSMGIYKTIENAQSIIERCLAEKHWDNSYNYGIIQIPQFEIFDECEENKELQYNHKKEIGVRLE